MGAVQQMFLTKGGTTSLTYATWNNSDKGGGITLSGGNLISASTTGNAFVRSTQNKTSGKWYWECSVTASNDMIGFATSAANNSTYCGGDALSMGYHSSGQIFWNGGVYYTTTSYTTSDIIGFALNADAGRTIDFYKNNTLVQTISLPFFGFNAEIFAATGYVGTTTANFGASTLTYTPPTGYASGLYT